MQSLQVHRDSFNTPWGFRLQGGKDFTQPLTVQRVFYGSPAEGILYRGDVIKSINERDATYMIHKEAMDLIANSGGTINFVIQRMGNVGTTSWSPMGPGQRPVANPSGSYTLPRTRGVIPRRPLPPEGVTPRDAYMLHRVQQTLQNVSLSPPAYHSYSSPTRFSAYEPYHQPADEFEPTSPRQNYSYASLPRKRLSDVYKPPPCAPSTTRALELGWSPYRNWNATPPPAPAQYGSPVNRPRHFNRPFSSSVSEDGRPAWMESLRSTGVFAPQRQPRSRASWAGTSGPQVLFQQQQPPPQEPFQGHTPWRTRGRPRSVVGYSPSDKSADSGYYNNDSRSSMGSGNSPLRSTAPAVIYEEQEPGGGGGPPQAVNLQYNTPIGLYSNQNVQEAYQAQSGQLLNTSAHSGGGHPTPVPQQYNAMADNTYIDNTVQQSGSFKILQDLTGTAPATSHHHQTEF